MIARFSANIFCFSGNFLILVLCVFYNYIDSKMLLFVRNSKLLFCVCCCCRPRVVFTKTQSPVDWLGVNVVPIIVYISFFGACCSKKRSPSKNVCNFHKETTMFHNLEKSYNKSLQLMLQASKFACAGYICIFILCCHANIKKMKELNCDIRTVYNT